MLNQSQRIMQNYTIFGINFKDAFENLTDDEKTYLYYLSKACWVGKLITLFQNSYESPALFLIFQKFFCSFSSFQNVKEIILKKNITDVEYNLFISYVSKFYSNFGNYSMYGNEKFIPKLSSKRFQDILKISNKFSEINFLWSCIEGIVYDCQKSNSINLDDKYKNSSFYLGDIKENQINYIDKILKENQISLLNTRLLSLTHNKFVVLISSVDEIQKKLTNDIILYYGEFSSFLRKINENLENAKNFCSNENEENILRNYIDFFNTGDMEKHKESQRKWIKDISPPIEVNFGWIPSYTDPMGVRGNFSAWVGITDKFNSKKYSNLCDIYNELISKLPWDKQFEKENNLLKNFIGIEIVCNCKEEFELGRNSPNYREITEFEGFKIINILNLNKYEKFGDFDSIFFNDKDLKILSSNGKNALILKTALHAFLGHGTGKLLRKDENNKFNFDVEHLLNPITGNLIDNYYNLDETYEDKFKDIAKVYEEFRADLHSLFFCFEQKIYQIFEINHKDYQNVIYAIWIKYIHQGIYSLYLYDIKNKTWNQSYSIGAWVFVSYLIENQKKEKEILIINFKNNEIGIKINYEMIIFYGRDIVQDLLIKIHIWKCTGNYERAKKFIEKYLEVNDDFLKIRKKIYESKYSLRYYLYHNLKKNENDNTITILEYPETMEGIIQSYVERYGNEFNNDIYQQWIKYETSFLKNNQL